MGFVRFTDIRRSYAAKVSLSSNGILSFNNGARKRFELDKYKSFVLYYDSNTKRVGVELTNDENAEGARQIRFRKTSGADLAAKSFADYFNIAVDVTTVYPIERDEANGMIVIDLSKGSARKKSRSDDENALTEDQKE